MLSTLVRVLDRERRALSPSKWRELCGTVSRHEIMALLAEDPYVRDARSKPAGYAGDARTLDYVYLRQHGDLAISALGQRVFGFTTGAGIADAVRGRCRALAREIDVLLAGGRDVRVTSLACGHCRELDHLSPRRLGQFEVWAGDQDARTVEHLRARLAPGRHQVVQATVGAILKGSVLLPPSDLVYASGLFDYLDDQVASVLLSRMAAALRPGARALIANLTPDNEEIGFMEAVMDWWMFYRSPEDLRRLADCLMCTGSEFTAASHSSADGRIAWLALTRSGNPESRV
jgi:SAM-dependent methyltransferase